MVQVVGTEVGQSANDTADNSGPVRKVNLGKHEFTTADTVAAVTIAVLATTVLLTIICIIRLLRKRRRQQQGEPVNRTPTVYASTLGASVMAYHNLQIHMQNDVNPRWEPVQVMPEGERPSTSSIDDPQPSTSYNRDDEIPVVSIISIHNHIQQRRNSINARNGVVNEAFTPSPGETENGNSEDHGNFELTNHEPLGHNQSDESQQLDDHGRSENSQNNSNDHNDLDR